jgi:hypothetical protein
MDLTECSDLWIACMRSERIVPLYGKDPSKEKRKNVLLFLRQSVIINFGFGMRHLVMREH